MKLVMHEQTAFLHWMAFLLGGACFIATGCVVGALLRARRHDGASSPAPYESGELSVGTAGRLFPMRFYAMGIAFILFEAETLCLLPWASSWHRAACGVHCAAGLGIGFLLVLTLGLIHVLRHTRSAGLPAVARASEDVIVPFSLYEQVNVYYSSQQKVNLYKPK